MNKRFILISVLALLCGSLSAQNNLGKADDEGRLVLTPYLAHNANYPVEASDAVKNKLMQIVTQYGLGGVSYDQRFVITANFTEYTREATATAPPMIALEITPTLYIGDLVTGNLYASVAVPSVKGVGKTETKAYMTAIKTMRFDSPQVAAFIERGKQKIIEYYNAEIDLILAQADALAQQDRYDDALALLISVPSVCKDAYTKAMSRLSQYYQMQIDVEGASLLAAARYAWSSDLSYAGAQAAASYLAQIHPYSSSYAGAQALAAEIAKRVKELDTREWNFTLQEHKDNVSLRSQAIKAAQAIGVARAKQPVTYYNKIYWW